MSGSLPCPEQACEALLEAVLFGGLGSGNANLVVGATTTAAHRKNRGMFGGSVGGGVIAAIDDLQHPPPHQHEREQVAKRRITEVVFKLFEEIEAQLVLPDVVSDRELYARLMREHAEIQEVVEAYRQRRSIAAQLEEALALRDDSDSEIREMAQGEARDLGSRIEEIDAALQKLLLPRDPLDRRNAILEIRAGTGGAVPSPPGWRRPARPRPPRRPDAPRWRTPRADRWSGPRPRW